MDIILQESQTLRIRVLKGKVVKKKVGLKLLSMVLRHKQF